MTLERDVSCPDPKLEQQPKMLAAQSTQIFQELTIFVLALKKRILISPQKKRFLIIIYTSKELDGPAVVSSHQPALGPRGGLWPVLLMCDPEDLYPSSKDINRPMMMILPKAS
jgi:dihydropteroate synthase